MVKGKNIKHHDQDIRPSLQKVGKIICCTIGVNELKVVPSGDIAFSSLMVKEKNIKHHDQDVRPSLQKVGKMICCTIGVTELK